MKKVQLVAHSALQLNQARTTDTSCVKVSEFDVIISKRKESVESTRSVPDVFKQRLVTHRRNLSKQMVFTDQLEIRDP